ncbi:MAG: hypothetical protein KGI33_03365 [Thaumarchaeota archaeon]|nr:hypothetical protein [Nitrososphaerota archaeon]
MSAWKPSIMVFSLAFVLAGFVIGGNEDLVPLQMGLAYGQLPPQGGPGEVGAPGSGISSPGDIGSIGSPGEVGAPGSGISSPGDNSSLGGPGDVGIQGVNSTDLGPGYLSGNSTVSQPLQNTSAVPEFGPVASIVLFVAVMTAVLLGSGMKFRGPFQSGS